MVKCFLRTCHLNKYHSTSPMATCLLAKNSSHSQKDFKDFHEWNMAKNLGAKSDESLNMARNVYSLLECLSVSEDEISVKWFFNGTIFSYGWSQPLVVQVKNNAILLPKINFPTRF